MTTPIIDPSALTEEQREQILLYYNIFKEVWDSSPQIHHYMEYQKGAMAALQAIFGESMFQKGE